MKKALVLLAQGCEELEAVTVIDLLRRSNTQVTVAGLKAGPVLASRGTVILADMTLDEARRDQYDMVVLPGGLPGADHLMNDPRVITLVQSMLQAERYVAAICAAPKVLARAGALKGKRFTAFPGAVPKSEMTDATYVEDAVVQDGHVITSRGPGTAMDFALHLIGVLNGEAAREQVEASLQRPAAHRQRQAS